MRFARRRGKAIDYGGNFKYNQSGQSVPVQKLQSQELRFTAKRHADCSSDSERNLKRCGIMRQKCQSVLHFRQGATLKIKLLSEVHYGQNE